MFDRRPTARGINRAHAGTMWVAWRTWLARLGSSGAAAGCFVTWRLAGGQGPLRGREREVVFRTILRGHGIRYRLVALAVMDDHVHVLVRGTRADVEACVASWKSQAGYHLRHIHRRRGALWEPSVVTTPLASEEALRERAYQVLGNPWKRWPFLRGYAWVWEDESSARAPDGR